MPFALIFVGLVLIVTGSRNTYAALGAQLQNDFTGPGNFIGWIVGIGAVGSLGYIKELRTFSHYFLALIIIGLLLSNQGFFSNLTKALAAGPVAPTASDTPTLQSAIPQGSTASATGEAATTPGQAKANGWINYGIKKLFGL